MSTKAGNRMSDPKTSSDDSRGFAAKPRLVLSILGAYRAKYSLLLKKSEGVML